MIATEEDVIEVLAEMKPSACSCDTCKNMCRTTPCIGTPQDIRKIIEAGHGDKLAHTFWAAGLNIGMAPVPIIAPLFDDKRKCCSFLKDDGLCSLHNSGLKPIEGKLTNHEAQVINITKELPVPHMVALTWCMNTNHDDIVYCYQNVD